jgi:hypothetical protein
MAGDVVAQWLESQTAFPAVPGSIPSIPRLGQVVLSCNPYTGGSEQGMAWGGSRDKLVLVLAAFKLAVKREEPGQWREEQNVTYQALLSRVPAPGG